MTVDQLFHFEQARRSDPAVTRWMDRNAGELGSLARYWFDVMRNCGEDVRELIHDGAPTACVTDAAFAYVNACKAHVSVGFFRGAHLADPTGLLQGTGKRMRHVKLRPGVELDSTALASLVRAAYEDMKRRLERQLSPS